MYQARGGIASEFGVQFWSLIKSKPKHDDENGGE
jgi:hypothetical protein